MTPHRNSRRRYIRLYNPRQEAKPTRHRRKKLDPTQSEEARAEDVKVPVVPKKPENRAPQISFVDGKLQINRSSTLVSVDDGGENSPKIRVGVETGRRGKKKERAEKWSAEETEKFYKALQLVGTDFSIISNLLPGRSRKQIKVLS